MKRWIAGLLCMLLVLSTALAEGTFWPDLDLTASPMQLTISAEAVTHMPYDDTRVAWLNGLLKHITLTADYQQVADETYMDMAVRVDDDTIFTITECEEEQYSMVQLSLTPGVTYVSPAGTAALDTLMGIAAAGEPNALGLTLADLAWMDDAEALMNLIRREWMDSISNKADKQSISGYGTATRRLTLTVAADDAEAFGAWLTEHCPRGRLAEVISQLTFTGKQTLVWRIDAEDRVHQFTYNGSFKAEGIDKRKLSITWNMARTATTTKDSLAVKTPQSNEKKAEYNTLNWKRTQQEKNGVVTDKEEFTYTQRIDGQKLSMSGSADVTRTDAEGLSQYAGTIQLKRTLPDADDEQLDLTLDLAVDEANTSVQGDVKVASMVDSLNREAAVLHISLIPDEPVKWSLQPENLYLDTLAEAELQALTAQITQRAALALIRPLVLLPREDTLFLSQDLSDEAWEAIVDAAKAN